MQLVHPELQLSEEQEKLIKLVNELKKQKNAVVLVHNYQKPEMFQIADFIGDSLDLSKKAAETDADMIIFCGVHFMAETAKILSPKKKVILPALDAGCSLADMATPDKLQKIKEMHPDAAVVSYVNTSAAIKAMSDACCTSMNAVKIVNSLPHNKVIFLPDKNLGRYVASKTDKQIILWDGYCFVHDKLNAQMLEDMKKKNPGSKVIAHPECKTEILEHADHICGTGGMAKFANEDPAQNFIVVTECGMNAKLQEDVPDKNFYSFCNVCPYMKATTLPLVARAVIQEKHEVTVPEETRVKAKEALDKMFELG